jgi:hypothetical protein
MRQNQICGGKDTIMFFILQARSHQLPKNLFRYSDKAIAPAAVGAFPPRAAKIN